ncbi:hypothetical protein G3N18_13740, partial [Microbacterium sp. 2C]|nr:hypothetical protein [Microbacterium paulum]
MTNRHAPTLVVIALAALLTTGCAASSQPRLTVLPTPLDTASPTSGATAPATSAPTTSAPG